MDKDQYKRELLAAYEDEVSGKAYFESLAHFYREPAQKHKLIQVANLEQQTAERLKPLLQRYQLKPQSTQELYQQGIQEAQSHGKKNWRELMAFFKDDYTKYIDEFRTLESAGSEQDQPALRALTQHEIALVEFVTRELAGDTNSLQSIEDQLTGC